MSFVGKLLPYQPEAVDKMCERGKMLVAYDLGLGKTVLTIAAIERLMDERKVTEPGLIICLSSLKYQWAASIKKFTDGSTPIVIDGSAEQRKKQYERALKWKTTGIDYIIMNYEQVVNDWDYVSKLPRGFVVLDEATAIKSFKSKRSKATKKLATCEYRFALTGTPVENGKPEELFSIMQFVDDSVLGRFDKFDMTFIVRNNWGGVDRYRNLSVLHERMKEASVRKAQKDSDVAPFLPSTIHKDPIYVMMDRKTANLYKRISDDLLMDLDNAQTLFGSSFNVMAHYGFEKSWGGPADELRGQVMSKLGALKMLTCSPELLKSSANKFRSGNGEGSKYAAQLDDEELLEKLPNSKLEAFVSYAKDFLEQDEKNKLVVFCSYVDMVDIIADRLGRDIAVTYTGKLDAKTKEKHKDALNSDPNTRVIVSSDAGGYGVDLPAANMLINYDLPWSSGLATQRNGRIRRASSEWKTIVIQDFLVTNSVEVRQFEALQQKNAIASAVIDGEGINDKDGVDLTIGTLRGFLLDTSV
jgi:SNF2 family DNA or RNA helicase